MKYSTDPDELLLQLAPKHAHASLTVYHWNQDADSCWLSLVRPKYDRVTTDTRPLFRFDQAGMNIQLEWTGGNKTTLMKSLERKIVSAVNAVVQPCSFTIVPILTKTFAKDLDLMNGAFKLESAMDSLPPGLSIPEEFHCASWTTFLPTESPEGKAYVAACQLAVAKRAAQTAKPEEAALRFEDALSALE
jgi:hypothetical protein